MGFLRNMTGYHTILNHDSLVESYFLYRSLWKYVNRRRIIYLCFFQHFWSSIGIFCGLSSILISQQKIRKRHIPWYTDSLWIAGFPIDYWYGAGASLALALIGYSMTTSGNLMEEYMLTLAVGLLVWCITFLPVRSTTRGIILCDDNYAFDHPQNLAKYRDQHRHRQWYHRLSPRDISSLLADSDSSPHRLTRDRWTRWENSTKVWKYKAGTYLDDISDFINFGLHPGLWIWVSMQHTTLAVLYVLAILYRLTRFTLQGSKHLFSLLMTPLTCRSHQNIWYHPLATREIVWS